MNTPYELLANVPPGPVAGGLGLDHALAGCWEGFRGSDEGGMESYKLLRRMENVWWQPSILTFNIERHGGTL